MRSRPSGGGRRRDHHQAAGHDDGQSHLAPQVRPVAPSLGEQRLADGRGHVARQRRDAPGHVEAGVLIGVDVDEDDHRHGEGRGLVGERGGPVDERVADPRAACEAGTGPRWCRSPVTLGSSARADEARHRGGERGDDEQPHRPVGVDGDEQEREASDGDDGGAGEDEPPAALRHQPNVEQQRQGRADAQEDEERGTEAAVPVAQLVHRGRAHDQEVRDGDDRRMPR